MTEPLVVDAVDTEPPPSLRRTHKHEYQRMMFLYGGDTLLVCFGCGARKVQMPWWRRVGRWLRLQFRSRKKVWIDPEDTQ